LVGDLAAFSIIIVEEKSGKITNQLRVKSKQFMMQQECMNVEYSRINEVELLQLKIL